jgi:hypothetical protein
MLGGGGDRELRIGIRMRIESMLAGKDLRNNLVVGPEKEKKNRGRK